MFGDIFVNGKTLNTPGIIVKIDVISTLMKNEREAAQKPNLLFICIDKEKRRMAKKSETK